MHYYHNGLKPLCQRVVKFILIFMFLIVSASCEIDPNFMTPQLKGLKLGVPKEEIQKKIAGSGKFETKKITDTGRTMLTWIPYDKRKFTKVEFEFTEKDRLYLARFYISEQFRFDSQKIRDDFFDYFKISDEFPSKMRIKDSDVILYGPVEKAPHFFDFTNVVSGEKSFEIFDKYISASDREKKLRLKKKAEKSKTGSGDMKAPKKAKNFLSLDIDEGNGAEKEKESAEKD